MDRVVEYFGAVADPRAGNARHDFLEVIFVALAASLCGAEDCTEMALFARAKLEVLRQVVKLDHGAEPRHVQSGFPDDRTRALRGGVRGVHEGVRRGAAGRGGDRREGLAGAYARGRRTMPLHLVNIWAAETRLVIGQRLAPGRNEVLGASRRSRCSVWTAASSPPTRSTAAPTRPVLSSLPGPTMRWPSRPTSRPCSPAPRHSFGMPTWPPAPTSPRHRSRPARKSQRHRPARRRSRLSRRCRRRHDREPPPAHWPARNPRRALVPPVHRP